MPVKIHGKEYFTVAERLTQIHDETGGAIDIRTKVCQFDSSIAMVKATVVLYREGVEKYTFTGHAFERSDASRINQTSHLEVCETSAIGRALASAGFSGGNEFASADEVANAVTQQQENDAKPKPAAKPVEPQPARTDSGTSASPKSLSFMRRLIDEKNWKNELSDANVELITGIEKAQDEDLTQYEVSETIDLLKPLGKAYAGATLTTAPIEDGGDQLPF